MTPSSLTRLVARDRRRVDGWLHRSLRLGPDVPGRLSAAMRYAVMGPGKRVRAILALEAYRAAGGRDERWVAPFCCGIEMIHSFSLVHDDLPSMDDDDYRRGRPSCHRRFDEATAILAADALLAYAFELFGSGPAPAVRRLAATAELSRAVGPRGMAGGQMLDIRSAPGTGRRALARIHRMKTAEFLAASLVAGAVLGGVGRTARATLARAGLLLGDLFQATDDLLDAAGRGDRRASAVSTAGVESTRCRAARLATRAGRLFESLGRRYVVLAAFPRLILDRTR